ncbi:MAG: hypothetical protein V7K35_16295 [Nostoc sp.]
MFSHGNNYSFQGGRGLDALSGLTQKLLTSLNLSNRQDEAVRWAALPT